MARVSTEDVVDGGFSTKLGPQEIKDHIEAANLYVDRKLSGEGLSDERMAAIEKEITRHFIRIGPERANETYTESDLTETPYGERAIMLDSSRSLKDKSFDEFFTIG